MKEDDRFAHKPMGMRMAMIVRQWRATIDYAIVETGLTQSSWTVLMQLSQQGDNTSISELAEVQGIELPPMMRTIKLLEKRGYLLRTTSPYDKRTRLLTLTNSGREILVKITNTIENYQERISSNISPLKMEQFSETLNQIAQNLRIIRDEDKK